MKGIEKLPDFKLYLNTVLRNARHHAHNVEKVIPAIAGEVLARASSIQARKGITSEFGNIAQFTIGENAYALTFNHDAGTRDSGWIELRKGNARGEPIHRFTNETPVAEINQTFATL